MFGVISTSVLSNELKKVILANSLANIQGKKNKFIPLELRLKLLNGYMKKMMQNKHILSIDVEHLFKYSSRFANIVQDQFLWIECFHGVWVNIKHLSVSQKRDLIKLTYKLSSKMQHQVNCQIFIADQAQNLFTEANAALKAWVCKFNCKWESAPSALNRVKIEEQINCNLADLYAD